MTKLQRCKLRLPVAETLHIAHVLAQAVQGLLTGANNQRLGRGKANEAPWTSHIFAAKDGTGRKTVLNFFGRLEYQDGCFAVLSRSRHRSLASLGLAAAPRRP